MKKTRFLWAAALVIALVAMLAACPADEGLSLPGKAGNISDVTSFPGLEKPANEQAALTLLSNAISFFNYSNILSDLNELAAASAFKKKEGKTMEEWLVANKASKSFSVSLKLTDADNAFADDYPDYSKVKITGSSDGSVSSNLTIEELFMSDEGPEPKKGDTITYKSSFNKTADFRDTKLTFSGGSYEVYGIIKAEQKVSMKSTVTAAGTEKDGAEITAPKSETSYSSTGKTSVVLSVRSGTTTAKYKFSLADTGSGKERKANGSNESIISDIEVYDSGDKLLWKSKPSYSYSLDTEFFNDFPFGGGGY